MDGDEFIGAECEGSFVDDFGYVCRHTVGLLFVIVIIVMLSLRDIVLFHQLFGLVDGDFSLDMATSRLLQVFRHLKTIHGLQADGYFPGFSLLALVRFARNNILVKVKICLLSYIVFHITCFLPVTYS